MQIFDVYWRILGLNLRLFEYLMQLTDTLSHNIISHKRDTDEPVTKSVSKYINSKFVLPHWASRPSPVATRPSGHKKRFFRPCPHTSSTLRVTDDRSFRYASPSLCNQLPPSLRQPHSTAESFSFSFYFRNFNCLCFISSLIIDNLPLSFTLGLKPIFSTNHSHHRLFSLSSNLTPWLLVCFRYIWDFSFFFVFIIEFLVIIF